MNHLLIATDGSPSAQEAVAVGLELAKGQGADVALLHVLPPDRFRTARMASRTIPHDVEVDASESALKEAGKRAEAEGVAYALERVSGETVETIVGLANESDADVIVLGSRGRGAAASALLGSVSNGVLHHAGRPVLIVRDGTHRNGAESARQWPTKILVAYDGFEHSDAAVRTAIDLFHPGADITVLSVVPPDARGSKSGGHVGLRPHAHEDVARAHAALREKGIEARMEIAHGEIVDSICGAAADEDVDVLVVGSRRLGTLGQLSLGTVSGELVHRAPCPVLVSAEDRD
jgi:nucleotide-binding universal stress UspA family protein